MRHYGGLFILACILIGECFAYDHATPNEDACHIFYPPKGPYNQHCLVDPAMKLAFHTSMQQTVSCYFMRWNRIIPIMADAFLANASLASAPRSTLNNMARHANLMFCNDTDFVDWTLATGPDVLVAHNNSELDIILLKLGICLGRDFWKYWTSDYASSNYALLPDGSITADFYAYGEGHVRMCAQANSNFFAAPTESSLQECVTLGKTCPSVNHPSTSLPLGTLSITAAINYAAYGLAFARFKIPPSGIPCIYQWTDDISALAVDNNQFLPTVIGTREKDYF